MIEWRIYRGDKPSPVLTIMQVLIEDWKRDNISCKDLDGLELMETMGIIDKGDKSVRLERVEVPWMDKEGRVLEELDTLIKKPSRTERRRVEREYLKGLKKANNGSNPPE